MISAKQVTLLAFLMAFISGVSALIYQVSWVKLLALSLGSTTIASAAVIGSFMGGMGIGARLYEFFPRAVASHFRRYGFIECGIGLTALLITPLLPQLPEFYLSSETGGAGSWMSLPVIVALLLVSIPSILMGATFPALCAALIRTMRGVGQNLGMVYGLNTLGAAAGALLTGFLLIEQLGIQGSVIVGVAGNLFCALGAFALSRTAPAGGDSASPSTAPRNPSAAPQQRRVRNLVLIVLFGSGFATMAYEMVWIRILKYVVGNSTYAVSLVVTIFLLGLALGGLIHRRFGERSNSAVLLAWTQAGIAVCALAALGAVSWLLTDPEASRKFSTLSFQVLYLPWWKSLLTTSSVSVAILLPPTIFMGLSFPLGCALLIERVPSLGRDLGTAYIVTNAGSILGVFAGALFLLPSIGSVGTTKAMAGLNMLLALLVIYSLYDRGKGKARLYGGVGIAALCTVFAVALPDRLGFRGEAEAPGASRLLFYEEDEFAAVKVLQQTNGESRKMTIDGFVIGASRIERDALVHKQLMLAHTSMALRPNARQVLNVGLGSATTLEALATYPDIASLTCVEISPAVVEGARYFGEGAVLNDPRLRLEVDDAVHFLLRDNAAYDLIVSDCKQNFQYSGNATILSREFYDFAMRRLADDGLFVQWIPMNLPPRAFRIVLRTFVSVFPEAYVYYYTPDLLLMVGGNRPIQLPDIETHDDFGSPRARLDLIPFDTDDIRQVLTGMAADAAGIRELIGDGEVNSWNNPLLEFVPYREFRIQENAQYNYLNLELLENSRSSDTLADARRASESLAPYFASSNELRRGIIAVFRTGSAEDMRAFCEKAEAANPADPRPALIKRRITGGVRNLLSPGAELPPPTTQ